MPATLLAPEQSANVLIVEDDAGMAELERSRLEESGYRAVVVSNAEDALREVTQGEIDLVLLDYRLPGEIDGLDFYAQVKASGYDLPVILVTGFSNEATVIHALRIGVRDFVTKSMEYLDYLPEAVDRVLRQVKTEKQLAESEARLAGIIGSAKDAVIVVEANRRISLFNPAAERMFGCSASQAIGQPIVKFIPDELEAPPVEFSNTLSHRLRTGTKGVRLNGAEFPLEASVATGRVGSKTFYTLVVRDVTERKQAEETLRRSEALLRRAEELAHVAGWTYEIDTRTFISSEEGARICGQSPAPHRIEELESLIYPDDRLLVQQAIQRGVTGVPFELEHRLVVHGQTKWVSICGEPESDEGRIVRIIGVTQDITARRNLEEQLRQAQKMDAFGQLAGGVAHDFNNLLTIINGYGELLLESLSPNDPNRGAIDAICDAGKRANGLTSQLLSFSRRAILEPRVLNLNEIVSQTGKMLERLIGEDVALSIQLASTFSLVRVDPGQMGQVLMNLAVNARDAMPQGGNLTLETRDMEFDDDYARLHHDVVPGRYVMIAVTDTGTGMTDEVKSRIFEPFFTTKLPGKGTGLGLATTYGIVHQSGGHIEVSSELGKGTIFRIYLPAVDGTSSSTDTESTKVARGTETVLLVEDQADVRAFATLVLQIYGYTVLSAVDGYDALQVVLDVPKVDILVTDVVMPRMGGRELGDNLRLLYPSLKVLFMSGYTDDTIIRHGISEADVAFLQKPYTSLTFARKVREVLDQRKGL